MSTLARSAATVHRELNPGNPKALNDSSRPLSDLEMDVGVQPLDALMIRLGLTNRDLVARAAGTGLTHKQVAKARRGRRITLNIQDKILRALNSMPGDRAPFRREECFTYKGR
jgi:DNA-binding Xre family transcriptional regulator